MSAYNRPQQQAPANTASWGYSRGGAPEQQQQQMNQPVASANAGRGGVAMGGTGIADYGQQVDAQNRRPHTAHGARAGFPSTGGYSGAPIDPKQAQQQQQQVMYDGGEGEVRRLLPHILRAVLITLSLSQEGDHVVAGARGMMRYRRNRATTLESAGGTPIQQQPQQSQQQQPYGAQSYIPQQQQQMPGTNLGGANAGTPWATYQSTGGSKPVNSLPQQQMQQQQQAQQQMALRKVCRIFSVSLIS